jgi:cell division protein FtsA
MVRKDTEGISIKHDGEVLTFSSHEIDEIVDARLEEIFEAIQKELKKAGRAGQLPSGVVLTGGAANMKHMADYAKIALGLAARIGKPAGYGGVSDDAEKPEYAAAVGLMLMDSEQTHTAAKHSGIHLGFSTKGAKDGAKKAGGMLSNFLKRFKT